jgi:Flp pilus assembly protein protease CpaA
VFGAVLVVVMLFLRRGIVSLPEVIAEQRWARRAVDRVRGRRTGAGTATAPPVAGHPAPGALTGTRDAVDVANR